jgi:hypothetical protein
MNSVIKTYTIKDFDNYLWSQPTTNLNDEIKDFIDKLTNEVSAPSYNKTPSFSHNDKNNFKRKNKNKEYSENFKVTEIKKKIGIELDKSKIILALNKITEKTFDYCKNELIEIIDKFYLESTPQDQESTPQENIIDDSQKENYFIIGKEVFNIATNNSFYSSLYAKLYNILIEKYSIFQTIFNDNYDNYLNYFNDIKSVDPNEDYEEFCNINLLNEKRCSYSLFLTNCLKEKLIDVEKIYKVLNYLFELQDKYIFTKNNSNIINEVSKNIFILLGESKNYINIENTNYLNNIKQILQNKPNSDNSFTNKSKFKYMDLIDLYKT